MCLAGLTPPSPACPRWSVEHGESSEPIRAGRPYFGQQTTMLSWATLSQRAQKIKGLNFCASQFVTEDEVSFRPALCTARFIFANVARGPSPKAARSGA